MRVRVVLITGASTGIGRACGELLALQGWKVYGVSRHIEQVEPKPGFTCLNADVTNEAALAAVLATIVREAGHLDAVVNAAGYVLSGSVEDTSGAEAQRQLATNFFGAATVCRLVLPLLRAQGRGTIVNIGSIAGLVPMPFQAFYSASKAALTALTRALRLELRPFGVHAVMVEPGDFATGITAQRQLAESSAGSAYATHFDGALKIMKSDELGAQPPHAVAELVARVLDDPRPRASYLVGPWFQRLAVVMRAVLPVAMFDWGLRKSYGLP